MRSIALAAPSLPRPHESVSRTSELPPFVDFDNPDAEHQTGPHSIRPRVLLVDDEIDEQNALVKLLSVEGLTIDCVHSGAEALARVQSSVYDAIVLDLHLRDMLGLTVLSDWRRGGLRVPVVAVSGWYLDASHEEAALLLGAVGFLHKPLDASELAHALRTATSNRTSPPARYAVQPVEPVESGRGATGSGHRDSDAQESRLQALHERFMCGDAGALDELAAATLPLVKRRLHPRGSATIPNDWIDDAATDALMEYRARPSRYDPAKGPLAAYLQLAAKRNLFNRMDSARRLAACQVPLTGRERSEPEQRLLEVRDVLCRLHGVLAKFTPRERQIFGLMLAGERKTHVFARALSIAHLPPLVQRAHVKLVKDRLLHRIRRWRGLHRSTSK